MKTISDAAMTAIIAGEALVTGAVEIFPVGAFLAPTITWSTVGTYDLDAVTNGATDAADGLSAGVTVSGFDPSDTVRITMPGGGTYTAWNFHGTDAGGWYTQFKAIPNGTTSAVFWVSGSGGGAHATAAAAQAAFGTATFTGASSYTFYIEDYPPTDDTGGVTFLVEKGVSDGGVDVEAGDPIRLWGGYGPITFDGNTYLGLGDRAFAQNTSSAIGGVAQGMTIGLSGIDPIALSAIDTEGLQGATAVIHRLIFDSSGKNLLDHAVWDRGRVDTIDRDETIGGTAAISLAVESAARGLGHSGARQRADSDQRLIDPDDGYFKHTAYAGQKTLYWGGKKPAIGLHG